MHLITLSSLLIKLAGFLCHRYISVSNHEKYERAIVLENGCYFLGLGTLSLSIQNVQNDTVMGIFRTYEVKGTYFLHISRKGPAINTGYEPLS